MENIYENKVIRNSENEVIGLNLDNYSNQGSYAKLIDAFGVSKDRVTRMPENLFIGNSSWQYNWDVNTLRTINFDYLVFDLNMGKKLECIDRKFVYIDKSAEEKQFYLEDKLRELSSWVVFGRKGEFVHTYLEYSQNQLIVFSNFQTDFYKRLEDAFLEENVGIRFKPEGEGLVIGIYSELLKLK